MSRDKVLFAPQGCVGSSFYVIVHAVRSCAQAGVLAEDRCVVKTSVLDMVCTDFSVTRTTFVLKNRCAWVNLRVGAWHMGYNTFLV